MRADRSVSCARCFRRAKSPGAVYPYHCRCGAATYAGGTYWLPGDRPLGSLIEAWIDRAMRRLMPKKWKGSCGQCKSRRDAINVVDRYIRTAIRAALRGAYRVAVYLHPW